MRLLTINLGYIYPEFSSDHVPFGSKHLCGVPIVYLIKCNLLSMAFKYLQHMTPGWHSTNIPHNPPHTPHSPATMEAPWVLFSPPPGEHCCSWPPTSKLNWYCILTTSLISLLQTLYPRRRYTCSPSWRGTSWRQKSALHVYVSRTLNQTHTVRFIYSNWVDSGYFHTWSPKRKKSRSWAFHSKIWKWYGKTVSTIGQAA